MPPRTSLTMIVKNEAARLPTCLASVQDLVDEIVVVDTGSSDTTREVARGYGARVMDFPWCDNFAAARNESHRHATGQWLLWLDADEYFDETNRDKVSALFASLGDEPAAFVMAQHSLDGHDASATLVGHIRLFRNHPDIRWAYRVHEQILPALRRAGHAVRFTDIAIAHTGYSDARLRRGKVERNLRLLHLDLTDRPDDPFVLFNLGWAYADLGRYADAVPLLEGSLRRSHPADSITAKLYVLLSQCHRRLGQLEAAWASCRAGRACRPEDAELLLLEGELRHQRGDRAGARACWQRLLTPDSAAGEAPVVGSCTGTFTSVDTGLRGHLPRCRLAGLAREEGRDDEAEAHWGAALAEAPALLPARLGLAELYLRQRRWPELEQVLAGMPSEPAAAFEATVLRARGHLARQEFADARRLLEGALRQAPQALTPYIYLSHALLLSGDEFAAEPVLRHILAVDPSQAEAWRNLTVMFRRRGELREAITAAQSGRAHCPHDPGLLLLHGALLREAGDWINAESCLVRVLELDTGSGSACQRRAQARHQLALLCRDRGQVREAVAHWRALLAEVPDFPEARRCLAACAPEQTGAIAG